MTEQAPHRLQAQSVDRDFIRVASVTLAASLVTLNWRATQRAAAARRHAGFLNARIASHSHQQCGWWWWQHSWPQGALRIGNRILFLAPIWRACDHEVIYPMLILGAIAGLSGVFLMKPRRADLHGSATWADAVEMK